MSPSSGNGDYVPDTEAFEDDAPEDDTGTGLEPGTEDVPGYRVVAEGSLDPHRVATGATGVEVYIQPVDNGYIVSTHVPGEEHGSHRVYEELGDLIAYLTAIL